MNIVSLVDARDPAEYGGKAVQLGAALRAGLPVPGGLAVPWDVVEALSDAERVVGLSDKSLPAMCAVRSSAIGEDSDDASFAGAHLTVLGACGADSVRDAMIAVRESGRDAGALAYRTRMGLDQATRMGVVIQAMVDAEVAGVMFTRDPITGADQRVIEASWGLGEVVVAGLVTPDRYVLDCDGHLLDQHMGEKDVAIRRQPGGGTAEEPVDEGLVCSPCLDESQLAALQRLALACDEAFESTEHDIEFAFVDDDVTLLQRRPITRG